MASAPPTTLSTLRATLGEHVQQNEPLARYTSARIGGPAEYLYIANTAAELAQAVRAAWQLQLPLKILGAGSNILVSDKGISGLVILNKARQVDFREDDSGRLHVRAESGMMFPTLARACIQRGGAGLEWAVTVPGTVGGAVFGNAGAHGGDVNDTLILAEILQPDGVIRSFSKAMMQYGYRDSLFKRQPETGIILAAEFLLERGDPDELQHKLDGFLAHRKRTQPPGATIGSMFKNPPGDYAGRLIESAGLKGKQIGQAKISEVHANFFVNLGGAKAADVYKLIQFSREKVGNSTGVILDLEVELVGDWS